MVVLNDLAHSKYAYAGRSTENNALRTRTGIAFNRIVIQMLRAFVFVPLASRTIPSPVFNHSCASKCAIESDSSHIKVQSAERDVARCKRTNEQSEAVSGAMTNEK